MGRSGNPMTYMDGPHNVRLTMPQPIPPPESSHTLRKGLWSCHEVNGQIVITEQMPAQEAETFGSSDADLGRLSRAPRATASSTERVRQAPVGPRPHDIILSYRPRQR
ncbi:uncharacterized protein LAESUDRAFT_728392 [Laetiporus sulphureus 93-53]|uniref:Uncharacterized protein n=1 Tax=Laetiporus sulphureus 93-53 TaxID=1314785 RepID=A0A165D515_9APHY|nr:uncharacterized protein LAESUDRAFT_728392 [Laetiporus sulphureus 93-53]KZT04167.1 hypothetical protein LAESUDRAFT_728392 [Laetiporus sulphureus 93-53]